MGQFIVDSCTISMNIGREISGSGCVDGRGRLLIGDKMNAELSVVGGNGRKDHGQQGCGNKAAANKMRFIVPPLMGRVSACEAGIPLRRQRLYHLSRPLAQYD